jgi:predicted nucleotidyltransferase
LSGYIGRVATPPPLSRLARVLRRTSRDLDGLGRRWTLVGALAVSARTEPRFTRDIDVAIAVANDEDAESLVRELQRRGYRVHAIVEQEATGRLATARLLLDEEDEAGIVLDALFASSGIEGEVVEAAETIEVFADVRLPVASLGHLIALKVLAMDDRTRPHDRVDLVALLAEAGPGDISAARAALALIEQRGFHRQKDLAGELERLVRVQPPGRAG